MSSKRILGMTATRSDYDLLSYLYKRLAEDSNIDFKLIVSGTHLSKNYGFSHSEILKDQIPILAEIESLLDSDTKSARLKSAALFIQEALSWVTFFDPMMILYCGDREDAMAGALLATYLRIPGVHFFGGDHATDGNIDNPIRHAISKLSTVHFVTSEEHARRLNALGEPDQRIIKVGSPSIDKLTKERHISKEDLKSWFKLDHWPKKYAILTFHPMPEEEENAGRDITRILESLTSSGYFIFCNYPNVDSGNKNIIEAISNYIHPSVYKFKNLPREIFVNLMRHTSLIIGNSSAGIIEAPTLKIPVINVGSRQKGRLSANSTIYCEANEKSLKDALTLIESNLYQQKLKDIQNPYGNGASSEKIYRILKNMNPKEMLMKTEDPLNPNR
jgi:GDP/UDP-N,N'-diacetylbacillosamine 2-epimerase (hydrolysing)